MQFIKMKMAKWARATEVFRKRIQYCNLEWELKLRQLVNPVIRQIDCMPRMTLVVVPNIR